MKNVSDFVAIKNRVLIFRSYLYWFQFLKKFITFTKKQYYSIFYLNCVSKLLVVIFDTNNSFKIIYEIAKDIKANDAIIFLSRITWMKLFIHSVNKNYLKNSLHISLYFDTPYFHFYVSDNFILSPSLSETIKNSFLSWLDEHIFLWISFINCIRAHSNSFLEGHHSICKPFNEIISILYLYQLLQISKSTIYVLELSKLGRSSLIIIEPKNLIILSFWFFTRWVTMYLKYNIFLYFSSFSF